MNNFDTLILGFLAGIVVARIYIGLVAAHIMRKLSAAIEEAEKPQSKSTLETRVELINDVFFVYRLDNNEFVGQGRTVEELKERCLDRFKNPNVHIKITQGDPDALDRLKKQL